MSKIDEEEDVDEDEDEDEDTTGEIDPDVYHDPSFWVVMLKTRSSRRYKASWPLLSSPLLLGLPLSHTTTTPTTPCILAAAHMSAFCVSPVARRPAAYTHAHNLPTMPHAPAYTPIYAPPPLPVPLLCLGGVGCYVIHEDTYVCAMGAGSGAGRGKRGRKGGEEERG